MEVVEQPDEVTGWDALPDDWKEGYRNMALAAIKAMEEPTEAMCEAARDEVNVWGIGVLDCGVIYHTMVSTAIQEKEV